MGKEVQQLGDPYDHLASFKQVVRAEQITNPHTQVEGFGLTLESKALSSYIPVHAEASKSCTALA